MQRIFNNIWQKLQQIKATPYEIAAGFACGVAVSFTPFVGFHSILALVLAFIIRASLVAALIGTLFGNPWTFPLIWMAILYAGEIFLQGEISQPEVDFKLIFEQAYNMLKSCDFSGFLQDIWPILYPMIIGAIPFCLLSWIIAYIVIRKLVDKSEE